MNLKPAPSQLCGTFHLPPRSLCQSRSVCSTIPRAKSELAGSTVDGGSQHKGKSTPMRSHHHQQQQQADDVDLLERSYRQEQPYQPKEQPQCPAVSHSMRLQRFVRKQTWPLKRSVRLAERRLDANLATLAATIAFVCAMIALDRGIQDLLDDILGDSPLGSIVCIVSGLGLVVGVKLAGGKVGDFFSL